MLKQFIILIVCDDNLTRFSCKNRYKIDEREAITAFCIECQEPVNVIKTCLCVSMKKWAFTKKKLVGYDYNDYPCGTVLIFFLIYADA